MVLKSSGVRTKGQQKDKTVWTAVKSIRLCYSAFGQQFTRGNYASQDRIYEETRTFARCFRHTIWETMTMLFIHLSSVLAAWNLDSECWEFLPYVHVKGLCSSSFPWAVIFDTWSQSRRTRNWSLLRRNNMAKGKPCLHYFSLWSSVGEWGTM